MNQRALEFVKELNKKGWTVSERMAEQIAVFARAEVTRAVTRVKAEVILKVEEVDWKRL